MNDTIKYTSKNGYTGVMYGKSSYAVYDKDGHEVMHTGSRNFNTYEELVRHVEEYPKLREMLDKNFKRIIAESEEERDDIFIEDRQV